MHFRHYLIICLDFAHLKDTAFNLLTYYRTNNISRRKNIVFGGCGELTPPEIYK